jgi:hypothetical protein
VKSDASCTTKLQFRPTALQTYAGQLSINSNAYNNGTPVLNLSGTGSATGSIRNRIEDSEGVGFQRNGQAGRKSFEQNGPRRNYGLRREEHPRREEARPPIE